MIVGNGDIASVLKDRSDFLFFASGVSNSQEDRESEFKKEKDLLFSFMDKIRDENLRVVYFGSLSVFYKDSPYTRHKKRMEQYVKSFPNWNLIRLGNISWGKNPNTIINYLRAHPNSPIQDVYRYVIDKGEFLDWIDMIPNWNCEMNLPGRRMKVQEIYDKFVNV